MCRHERGILIAKSSAFYWKHRKYNDGQLSFEYQLNFDYAVFLYVALFLAWTKSAFVLFHCSINFITQEIFDLWFSLFKGNLAILSHWNLRLNVQFPKKIILRLPNLCLFIFRLAYVCSMSWRSKIYTIYRFKIRLYLL